MCQKDGKRARSFPNQFVDKTFVKENEFYNNYKRKGSRKKLTNSEISDADTGEKTRKIDKVAAHIDARYESDSNFCYNWFEYKQFENFLSVVRRPVDLEKNNLRVL